MESTYFELTIEEWEELALKATTGELSSMTLEELKYKYYCIMPDDGYIKLDIIRSKLRNYASTFE